MLLQLTSTSIFIMVIIWSTAPKGSRDFIWFTLVVLLLSSCNKRVVDLETLKTSSGLNIQRDSSSNLKVNVSRKENRIRIRNEENDYHIEITPDGVFHYDPKTGFTGQAKNIKIWGKSKVNDESTEERSEQLDSTRDTRLKEKIKLKQNSNARSKHSEATGFGWPSLYWLFLPVAAALIIFRKKLFKLFK